MLKKVLILTAITLTCLAAPVLAESPGAERGVTQENVRHIMEKYRGRLAELERTVRDAEAEQEQLLEKLYAELGRLSPAPAKSLTHCQQACTQLGTALGQITNAKSLSKSSWAHSCPLSSSGSDARVFSHNATTETLMLKNATCNTQVCNLSDLRSARDLAFDAWIAADDAYANDGCDADMQDASYEASDAWVTLHNAQYDCSRC